MKASVEKINGKPTLRLEGENFNDDTLLCCLILEKHIDELWSEKEDLKSANLELADKHERLRFENMNFRAAREALSSSTPAEVIELREEVKRLQADLTLQLRRVDIHYKEKTGLEKENAELERQIIQHIGVVGELEDDNAELKRQLAAMTNTVMEQKKPLPYLQIYGTELRMYYGDDRIMTRWELDGLSLGVITRVKEIASFIANAYRNPVQVDEKPDGEPNYDEKHF